MESRWWCLASLLLVLLSLQPLRGAAYLQERKNYIVHLKPRDGGGGDVEEWHRSFLPQVASPDAAEGGGGDDGPQIIYSYRDVFPGFAARLTDEEADAVRASDGCVRLYPEVFLPLMTTRSPGFLGLHLGNEGFWSRSGFGRGVVIGVLDTGILPTHPSFADDGIQPPPKGWNGTCEFKAVGPGGCNNKLIGARAFGGAIVNSTAPPMDDAGHGTHTASTAAGNFVENANIRGNADGTASGIAPHAHLAVYKVCARSRCSVVDIVAGLDAAVGDGVDVISFSLGAYSSQLNYDPIAIAAFRAMERGIVVSCAAGNGGPTPGTVGNGAPWVLTVAAGTMDRAIRTTVRLGNGQEFNGESLFQPGNNSAAVPLPLVFPGADGANTSRDCSVLRDTQVAGKVVLCESSGLDDRIDVGRTVLAYGGVGLVVMNRAAEGYTTFADPHVLPASHVSYEAGTKIMSYVNSTANATASIVFKGTIIGSYPSPAVTFFSSRGPNKASPGILKPDITGPGMNILAAWSPTESAHTEDSDGSAGLSFFVESGTSMSTPHLSGVAALLKSLHPDWTPAAIKSAIMTTSDAVDRTGEPMKDEQYRHATFYAMGAGYVNPALAFDPGLVYDLHADDYIPYLCGLGLGDDGVTEIAHRPVSCRGIRAITEAEINYPSLVVKLLSQPITVNRTVTNVGKPNSVYTAVVEMPKDVSVTVQPTVLRFRELKEKQSFTVTVRWAGQPNVAGAEGNLKWVSDGEFYTVRSPIVITGKVE